MGRIDRRIIPDIPYSKRPGPPLVPDAGTIDLLLHDYLRRADRMSWSPYDLVDHDAMQSLTRPQRLSEAQVGAVKTVLFVEDHLPGYLSEYLRIMTNPDLPDAQQIVSRKVLHFTFRWVGEEGRHAHVLEMYLTRSGLMRPGSAGDAAGTKDIVCISIRSGQSVDRRVHLPRLAATDHV